MSTVKQQKVAKQPSTQVPGKGLVLLSNRKGNGGQTVHKHNMFPFKTCGLFCLSHRPTGQGQIQRWKGQRLGWDLWLGCVAYHASIVAGERDDFDDRKGDRPAPQSPHLRLSPSLFEAGKAPKREKEKETEKAKETKEREVRRARRVTGRAMEKERKALVALPGDAVMLA